MSIESIKSRRNQYEKILEDWSIHELIGSGSGGKTGVFRITKNQEFEEIGALKVVNIIEIDGSFDKIHEEVRQGYELERGDLLKEAIREVDTMYKLKDCPHVMRYLDRKVYNWESDSQFGCDLLIRMDYRQTIWRLAEKRSLDEAAVIQIGIDICKALVECQKHNIIHRDIKPQNIFAAGSLDHYLLGDFGIARIVKDAYKATTHKGTDWYAAPEQYYAGKNGYDGRVDIYSLGLTLYVLLNKNNIPFKTREVSWTTANQQRLRGDAPLPPPCEASDELGKIILKACAYRREDRYQSAQEFLEGLEELKWQRTDFHKHRRDFLGELRSSSEDFVSSNTGELLQSSEADKLISDAKLGDEVAQFCSAIGYMDGEFGLPKDEAKAVVWYTQVAKKGNELKELAQYELGICYMEGKGVSKDEETGIAWFTKAAGQGYHLAQYELGMRYMKGRGVQKNEKKAIEWITMAAEGGYDRAQSELGMCYMNGLGVTKNEVKAVEWLTRAAMRGEYLELEQYYDEKMALLSVNLDKCTLVKSTVDGSVTGVCCHYGEMVQAGDLLVTVQPSDWDAYSGEEIEIAAPISGIIEFVAAYHHRKVTATTPLIVMSPADDLSENGVISTKWSPRMVKMFEKIVAKAKENQEPSEFINRDEYPTGDFIIEGGVLIKYCGQGVNVTLPAGIDEIGQRAFHNCTTLVSVSLNDGIKKIGKEAFLGCTNLIGTFLPKSIVSIGRDAFKTLYSADSLTLCVEENPYVEQYATENTLSFMSLSKDGVLTKYYPIRIYGHQKRIVLSKSVLKIGAHAFSRSDDLASVIISDGAVAIGAEAFWGCRYLTSVSIPSSVKNIESMAFGGCHALTIHAPIDSYAQQYAEKNHIPFSESQ